MLRLITVLISLFINLSVMAIEQKSLNYKIKDINQRLEKINALINIYNEQKNKNHCLIINKEGAVIKELPSYRSNDISTAKKNNPYIVRSMTSKFYKISVSSSQGVESYGYVDKKSAIILENCTEIFGPIISEITRLVEDYRNDPNISITGFDLGIPPSVSIHFDFKAKNQK